MNRGAFTGTFTGPLILEEIGYELWRIYKGFSYLMPDGKQIDIPDGRITDLTSSPTMARLIVPKIGYYSQAAVLHDDRYLMHSTGQDTIWTQQMADQLLFEASEVLADKYGIPPEKRVGNELYLGVRMGGLASWETPAERAERMRIKIDAYLHEQ